MVEGERLTWIRQAEPGDRTNIRWHEGNGLLESGACVLEFEMCPVCMQPLGSQCAFVVWNNANFQFGGHKIVFTFVAIDQKCSTDEPPEQVSRNLIRLLNEFGCDVYL